VLIELFSLEAEALRANIDWKWVFWKGVGQFRPNFDVEEEVPHQSFLHAYIDQWTPYRQAFAMPCVALHAVAQ